MLCDADHSTTIVTCSYIHIYIYWMWYNVNEAMWDIDTVARCIQIFMRWALRPAKGTDGSRREMTIDVIVGVVSHAISSHNQIFIILASIEWYFVYVIGTQCKIHWPCVCVCVWEEKKWEKETLTHLKHRLIPTITLHTMLGLCYLTLIEFTQLYLFPVTPIHHNLCVPLDSS